MIYYMRRLYICCNLQHRCTMYTRTEYTDMFGVFFLEVVVVADQVGMTTGIPDQKISKYR